MPRLANPDMIVIAGRESPRGQAWTHGQVKRPERLGGCRIGHGVDPVTVGPKEQGAAADWVFESNDAARLVTGPRGPIEDFPRVRIRCERLALDDADRRQHAEPVGACEIGAFAVYELLEVIKGAAVTDRQHIDRDAGGIGEFHRLGARFAVQRINSCLFKMRDGRRQILRVLIKPAQEYKDVVGARTPRRQLPDRVRRMCEHSAWGFDGLMSGWPNAKKFLGVSGETEMKSSS